MRVSRLHGLFLIAAVLSMVLAACGGGSEEPTQAPVATQAPQATTAPQPTQAPGATARPTAAPAATAIPAATPTAAPVPRGEMNIALANMSFELIMKDGTMRSYLDSMYDWVIGAGDDGKLDPSSGLATSWTNSADGKVWTIKTRDGIVFHNGTKASAPDIKANFDRMMAKGFPGTGGNGLRQDVAKVEAPDASTFVITLNQPGIFFHISQLSRLAGGSEPSHVIDGKYFAQVGEGGYNKTPTGSGPYKFASITLGDNVTVEAVDKHWLLGVPRTKSLQFKLVPEQSTRLALLKTNAIDITLISRAQLDDVKNTAGLQIFSRDNSGCGCYRIDEQFKTEYPGFGPNPLSDLRVRQAMDWYAIDRKALVETFMKGLATPSMNYPVFAKDAAYEPQPVPTYNPQKAKDLLREAGFAKYEIDFIIVPRPQIPEGEEIAEAMAVYWENIGFKVNRKPMEYAQYRGTLTSGRGFDRPTVFGVWFLGAAAVAGARISANSWAPASAFATNHDQDLQDAGGAFGAATTTDAYIKAGRAYQKLMYDKAVTTILFTAGEILGATDKIPKSYTLGPALYSFQFERAAALR